MTWLFSQALMQAFENSRSLPERAEEYSAATCSDGEPSAQLNVMLTPQQFWRNDKMMDCSKPSLFGLTLRPLTESRGEELLTWFRAAFLAKISASPAGAPGLKASVPGYGTKCVGLFAKFDPNESTWKTAQYSLLEDSGLFSETWPRWGSMRNGESYLRPIPARLTYGSESGYWPTPTVCGNYNRKGASAKSGDGLATAVKLWPTPTASLGSKGGRVTPQKSREGGTLIEAVSNRTWATATARDWRSGKASEATHARNSRPLSEQVGGLLNPAWVEWLMGWPIGWTELKPLATDKFQEWRQQHGAYSPITESEPA